jgi:hypothetical protein
MSKQPYVNQSVRDEHEKDVNAKRSLMMGWNSDDLEAYKLKVNSDGSLASPLPTEDLNGSITLSQSDNVVASTQTLTKTIGGVSYEKTLSYNSAGEFLSASAWSEV